MNCYEFAECFVSLSRTFDHNPPHIHVRSGTDNFTITIRDRIIEGKARSKTVAIIRSALPLA